MEADKVSSDPSPSGKLLPKQGITTKSYTPHIKYTKLEFKVIVYSFSLYLDFVIFLVLLHISRLICSHVFSTATKSLIIFLLYMDQNLDIVSFCQVDTFFAVGSPLGFFLSLRNVRIGIGNFNF